MIESNKTVKSTKRSLKTISLEEEGEAETLEDTGNNVNKNDGHGIKIDDYTEAVGAVNSDEENSFDNFEDEEDEEEEDEDEGEIGDDDEDEDEDSIGDSMSQ